MSSNLHAYLNVFHSVDFVAAIKPPIYNVEAFQRFSYRITLSFTDNVIRGTPDFGHELFDDDLERIEENMMRAIERVPVVGEAGIKRVINGPMIWSRPE